MAEAFFSNAREAQKIGEELIGAEDEFRELRDQHILWVGVEPAPRVKGKTKYGSAEVVSGKNAHLYWAAQGKTGGTIFRICISLDMWGALNDLQRHWLVRHELRHCTFKSTKKKRNKSIRPHDFELFLADMKDPAMESVCLIWAAVQEAAAMNGQMSLIEEEEREPVTA